MLEDLGCFLAKTFGLKNTIFSKSIADSERKLIQSHYRNSRPLNTNEIENGLSCFVA